MEIVDGIRYAVPCVVLIVGSCSGPLDTVADLRLETAETGGSLDDEPRESGVVQSDAKPRESGIVQSDAKPRESGIVQSDANLLRDAEISDSTSKTPTVSRDAYCNGISNPITVTSYSSEGTKTENICLGQWMSQAFRYALCSCKDAQFFGPFTTIGAFDSRFASCMQSGLSAGGSVGVNQNLFVSGVMSLTGSITVTGDQGLFGSAVSPIQGDLRIRGPFTCQGVINIARNAWLGSDLIGSGVLTVGGDLRQPSGANRDPAATITIGGRDLREPINLESPCACNDDQQLDIAAIIKEAESDNHNSEAGFDSNRFENVTGIESVELPCGRFFLTSINVVGGLTLQVSGRSALFISGDLTASNLFSVLMGQDATLDVFVGGKLSLSSLQTFGVLTRPANLRVYVAGDQPTIISGLTTFVGSLYAPRSRVELGGIQTVCGSIFAGDFSASTSATTSIFYDTSLLYQGDDCNPPPESCSRCDDCPATSACVEGKCGACRRDEDCCEPLRCFQGQCTVIVL